MNSYSFGISGEVWILIVLMLLALGATFWTYSRTNPPITGLRKTLLMSLRFLALAILIIVLFEPLFTRISGIEYPPKIAVLLDNSASMGANDAAGDRKEIIRNALSNSNFETYEDAEFVLFDKGNRGLTEFAFDSIDYKGSETDISQAIRTLSREIESENIRAAVIISDGRFNSGTNPIYDSEGMGIPFYTIGIGDTSKPKDLIAKNLITNDATFVDSPIPVNFNFSATGFPPQEVKVLFKDNGNLIEEKQVEIFEDRETYSLLFSYNPKVEGDRKLSFEIEALDGELTLKNNSISKFVKVMKNKRKIALFSGYPNSDLSFIKKVLSEDKGIEIIDFVQKNDSQFYTEPNENLLNDVEMFYFVAFPISSTPNYVIDILAKQLKSGKPVFFMSGLKTDYYKLRPLEPYLPFSITSSREKEFLASVFLDASQATNPLFKIDGENADIDSWNNLPPIYRTETFVKSKPESEIYAGLKVNNVDMQEPSILSRTFQGQKSIALLAYGLYRWKLIGYAAEQAKGRYETKDLYTNFIKNSYRWLSLTEINKKVRISTVKDFYVKGEEVEFVAQVYDASLNALDDANVSLELDDSENEKRQINLNSIGNGRYYAKVSGLTDGDYKFSGKATNSGGVIGTDVGRFNIGDVSLEFRDLTQNKSLLEDISARTGGHYYFGENTNDILQKISENSNFKSKAVRLTKELTIWDMLILLFVAIALFATEWIIRKRSGLV